TIPPISPSSSSILPVPRRKSSARARLPPQNLKLSPFFLKGSPFALFRSRHLCNSLKKQSMSNNKIALITGGSRGLGKSMALALAKNGTDLIITYRKGNAEATETVRELEALGRKA